MRFTRVSDREHACSREIELNATSPAWDRFLWPVYQKDDRINALGVRNRKDKTYLDGLSFPYLGIEIIDVRTVFRK
jgi:hypothetical protein